MPLLSVVVPIYNIEKYIRQCVESILTINDIQKEVILVNDGSTDGSNEVCKEYASHPEIIIINKENGGLSDARNTGNSVASGKYVMFVDGDDYIQNTENITWLINKLEKDDEIDVVQFKKKEYDNNTKLEYVEKFDYERCNNYTKEGALEFLIRNNRLPISACTKIIRRSTLIGNDIKFEKDLLHEDIDWSLELIKYIDKIYYSNENIYVYRISREGSITNNLKFRSVESYCYILDKWVKRCNSDLNDPYSRIYMPYLAYELSLILMGINRLDKEERKNAIELLRKYSYILTKGIDKKTQLLSVANRIVGFDVSVQLLRGYWKIIHKKKWE